MTLAPLRKRLEEATKRAATRLDVVQQDYLLSWVLAAMFKVDNLNRSLLFKGGTALKKCYFGEYRFSEDLDFTVIDKSLKGKKLDDAINKSIGLAEEMVNEYAPIKLYYKKYIEKNPHPEGQEAFTIAAQFPWQREALTKVMIELSFSEEVITPSRNKLLLHSYGENLGIKIPVYSLEEIVLEKHRAILQHKKKLHERDWGRSRARDYYDLWRIFHMYSTSLQFSDFPAQLSEKCKIKQVFFNGVEDFFDLKMLNHVRTTWEKWLGPLVPSLPSYEQVIMDLREHLGYLFKK